MYESEREARSELGVIMMVSRMVHGDLIANSTSWYLQTAAIASSAVQSDGDVFFGYALESNAIHPIAGGWADLGSSHDWEPFVSELERRRAHRAGLPWRREMLEQFSLQDCGTGTRRPTRPRRVDFSLFRFAPVRVELLVRPLDMCVTEPLF